MPVLHKKWIVGIHRPKRIAGKISVSRLHQSWMCFLQNHTSFGDKSVVWKDELQRYWFQIIIKHFTPIQLGKISPSLWALNATNTIWIYIWHWKYNTHTQEHHILVVVWWFQTMFSLPLGKMIHFGCLDTWPLGDAENLHLRRITPFLMVSGLAWLQPCRAAPGNMLAGGIDDDEAGRRFHRMSGRCMGPIEKTDDFLKRSLRLVNLGEGGSCNQKKMHR